MVGVSMIRSGLPDDLASDNSGSLRWLQSWFASVSISSELVSRHGFRDAPPRATFRWLCQRFRRRECTVLGLTTNFCTEQTIHLHHPTLLASIFENSNEHVRGSAGWHARDAIRPRCPRADSDEGSSHTTSKYQSDDRVCVSNRDH